MSTKENWDDESSDEAEEELNENYDDAKFVEEAEAPAGGEAYEKGADESVPPDEEAADEADYSSDDYDDDYDDEIDKKLGRYVSCR